MNRLAILVVCSACFALSCTEDAKDNGPTAPSPVPGNNPPGRDPTNNSSGTNTPPDDRPANSVRPLNLTEGLGGSNTEPAWSPDGTKIAFSRRRSESQFAQPQVSEIWMMDVDGSNPINLSNHPADEAIAPDSFSFIDGGPTWSPNSGQIAFYSTRDGQDAEIFWLDRHNRTLVQVTKNQTEDLDPAWSPFGDIIAFSSNQGGFPQLFLINSDGTAQQPLTNDGIGSFARSPAWSPNGARIAFTIRPVDDPDQDEVYIINPAGGGQQNLTNEPLFDTNPAWSPEGTKIAFNSDRLDTDRLGDNEIYVMEPDGSSLIQLTCNGADDIQPAWSPDSSRIAYASNPNPTSNPGVFDIYLLEVSTEGCGFTD